MKRQNNSGYTERENGTALSINAEWAESAGKYIKGDFVKRYSVARATFALLHECHVIEANEWHHVGKTFRCADFYEWADWNEMDYSDATCETGSLGKIYHDNKKTVDVLVKTYNAASVEEKEKPLSGAGFLYGRGKSKGEGCKPCGVSCTSRRICEKRSRK